MNNVEIDKLISFLGKLKIESSLDPLFPNIVFTHENKKVSVALRIFYRESGIVNIRRAGKHENEVEVVEVDDNMFYQSYMKQIILYHFKKES